eukprot:6176424-Pleurochrysis_carterae.AAC.2
MEQMLSSPPQATFVPPGAKAQVMTQLERSGMACTLLVVKAFHTMSLPSCEAETSSLLSPTPGFSGQTQCIA